MSISKLLQILVIILGAFHLHLSAASRIKDLVSLEGVRDNQLVGYGVVVGLAGTGDRQQTVFSVQSLTNLLQRMGVTVPGTAILVKNTAAVLVTGTLPPFAQPGTKIDVTVAAIGDASNLQGGLLILTPMRASNNNVFAFAQGSVVTGGFVAGRGGNSQTVNHPTVGRVVDGAIVEQAAPSVEPTGALKLQLKRADYETASRIALGINRKFGNTGHAIAQAMNSGLVQVEIPDQFKQQTVEFVAAIEDLVVETDRPATIAVNDRTGTLVLGGDIRISPVAILQGNLTVRIDTSYAVSQPNPLSNTGTTQVVPQVDLGVKEDKARNVVLKDGASVDELVRALMAIGSTPRDIIGILESLKAAGALDADIEVL
ncbi:MAG TPA: flagellar basal body P-ring protein FlgI [Bryobacteraceae bacterium]|nr:flagellar basal body P-ring protein FlgI [Bryobacteraceae bacterium]